MEPVNQSDNVDQLDEKATIAPRTVRPTDPDTFADPESARVRSRQLGCIGIRRYMNRNGGQSWMPCTNESDYRKYSGQGYSGRKYRRQQFDREVRESIGRNYGRAFREKSANYTKPELRERLKQRIMSGSKGGRPGQWSARKAQLLALAYRKAGGGYRGGKGKQQRSLVRWGKEKWRTSDGKPAIRGGVTRRYLPAKAWAKLTPAQRAATNRKKIAGSKRGSQFVANTEAAASARKRVSRGIKHIEFYDELDTKAVGSRVGGRIGRAIAPGRGGSGPRMGRVARRGRTGARQIVAPFDPNPVDADADLVVQEGTIFERTITPEQSLASRLGRGAVSIPRVSRDGRRERRDIVRGLAKPEPKIARQKKPRESIGRAIRELPKTPIASRRKPKVSPVERQVEAPTPKPSIPEVVDRTEFLRRFEGDLLGELNRNERAQIYNSVINGESTVEKLADKYNVVADEIQQVIRDHKKFRSSAFVNFRKQNPKLSNGIDSRFSNTKKEVQEAVRNGIVKNWDELLNFAIRSTGDRNLKEKITAELFNAFPNGKDPDGKSRMVLGYRRTKRKGSDSMVRDIANFDSMPEDFIPSEQYRRVAPTIESRVTSARDINERASRAREFRTYQRDIDSANMWDASISGRMATGPNMTPQEENEWRTQEWKRQQLKKIAIQPDFARRGFKDIQDVLGDQAGVDLAQAIQNIENLDTDTLNTVWDNTVQQMLANNMRIPAYRAADAPLTPKELAIVANAKRPLVAAFLDEVKKRNPNGNFAQIDVDNLSDKDVQDLFNTFILPELTNPNAPSIQDAQIAAGLPKSQEMVSLADSVAWVMPSGFGDLETRTLIAKERLRAAGMDPDDPAFDEALQQLIDNEYEQAVGDIEKWLAAGAPPISAGGDGGKTPPPINPDTGAPFGEDDWRAKIDELINRFNENVQATQAELESALDALYEIGRAQGWIDDENTPGDNSDDDNSFDVGDNVPTPSAPIGDEFGYPDTDEAWDAPYVDENGNEIPYDGSDTHPLNVNPETGQPYNVERDNTMDDDLYRFFLDPNNYHVREWMDIDNTHTMGRYTKPPAELASRFYDGDVEDPDPEKIDKRIDWDRLINYIGKVSPHFFKRDRKGEMVADISEITRSGDYDGASFNPTPDPDADPTGYQFRQQMKEYVEAKIKEEAAFVTSSDAQAKAQRAALWKLLETDTLTPDEIAFDERFFDVNNVEAALALHALENNISQKKYSDLLKVARAAAPTRADAYAKKRVERIAQEFKDQGKSSRDALREIDRAIEHQIELKTKVGLEYDQFRREYMALRNMITSLLMMRPKNRKQTYNRDGSIRQKGWDPKRESASRYLNRIARWDRQFIGHVGSDGEWRPGVVSQLVSRLRQNEIMYGAVGGGGATSDIFQTADQNIARLREMRELIEDARGEGKRFGISGFMRGPSSNLRLMSGAEEKARVSARRVAGGYSTFASPRSLKRYDDFGLPISRETRTSASGFNKRLQELIKESTRSRDFKWSESKYFNGLPDRLKDVVRGLDATPYTFSNRGFGPMFASRTAREGRNIGSAIARPEDFNAFELIPGNKLAKSGRAKRERRSISGAMRLMTDQVDGKWYVTDRNGDIVIDTPFDSHDDALFYVNQIQRDFEDKPEFQFNDLVRFEAYKRRIDTYPYHGEERIRRIADDMNSPWVEQQARGPKKTAADSVIVRINPETGEKEVALIRRAFPPFSGERDVNLPGGFVDQADIPEGQTNIDEKVFIAAAKREKLEEVGIKESDILRTEFIGENDEPDWDPRFPNGMRVGGVYFEVKPDTELRAGDDASSAFWVPIKDLADGKLALGFGHAGFIAAMLWDDDDSNLADRMSVVSALARRRNQRIIREVNRQRAIRNAGRSKEEQVPLFPKELPNPDQGFQPGGAVAVARAQATYRRLTGRMAGVGPSNVELNDGIRYALVNYTGDGFGLLNQLLRETNGLILDRELIKNREALRSSITSKDPSSLATRIAMGTDASYDRLMKELAIYRDMNDWLKAGTIKPNTLLYRNLGGWKGIDSMKEGDEFFDASFQSTTSNIEQGFLAGPRNIRIFVGEGVSGRVLKEGIDAPRHSEDEVILPAGVRYRILRTPESKTNRPGNRLDNFWDVEIVSQGISGAMKGNSSYPSNVNERFTRPIKGDNADALSAAIKRSISGKMAIPRKQFVGRDFYGDLDIQPTATLKEIKDSFREIAKTFHPDKNPGDKTAADKFRRATEAYEVLSDANERDYYDSTILPNITRDASKASKTKTGPSEPPRRPNWMNERPAASPSVPLPKLNNVLANRLGLNIPIEDNILPGNSSLTRYTKGVAEDGITIPAPDGGKIKFDEDRFWNVHHKIAKALNDAVVKKRPKGQKKKYVIIGGPPASGKTSLRLDKSLNIPSLDEAVHVDADEIKELIPEARKAHKLNDRNWASVVHDESRMIVNTSLRMAIENNNNVVHDSLGQFREGLGALKAAREAGYDVVAHYVVAPENIIKERLNEREKTDPRVIPRHIVDAAISNNKYAMPEIAEFADEFYLYDGTGETKRLIAKKEKNGELEILDPLAFQYGNFESLVPDNPGFERPDASKRSLTVAKNNVLADAIRDFDKGDKVTDIAKKYKLAPRRVYDAVRTYSVDENRTEVTRPTPKIAYGQGQLNFGDGSYYDDDYAYIPDLEDLADIPHMYVGTMDYEIMNRVGDTVDAGLEDELLDFISYSRFYKYSLDTMGDMVQNLKNIGWTDGELSALGVYGYSIEAQLERRPNGNPSEVAQKAEVWLETLMPDDKAELRRQLSSLATDAKRGTFAPTAEFIGLAEEFGVPLWVIDDLYEQLYSE